MNSVSFRLCAVAVIIMGAWGVNHELQLSVLPNAVTLPDWSLQELPDQFGDWHGKEIKLDPTITAATGAAMIVDRNFQRGLEQSVILHTAMFKNPRDGVYHSPLNCYAAGGWKKIDESVEKVQVADNLTVPVNVVAWEKGNQRILVAFWYQLGDYVVHDRFELGLLRRKMHGQEEWPVLFKVMTQIDVNDPEQAKKSLLDLTTQVGKWLNQPDHKKYLDRWGAI